MLVSEIGDYNDCLREVERFLPYVDNWATCDMFSPKAFKKHKRELLPQIKAWLGSGKIYTVRFAVTTLMRHYLDEDFSPEYFELVASVKSDEYYVKMAVAWYFATALAKQYDCAVKYIENYLLDKWTHNKTIQKARESFRVTAEQKEYLKKFKL